MYVLLQLVHLYIILHQVSTYYIPFSIYLHPWIEEPGRLQSTRSQRVRHNLVTYQQ